jgi:sugar phosphate isomerase/epimerase
MGRTTMKHEYSLAALSVLPLCPTEHVDVAARTGYQYVGLRITQVTPTEKHNDMVTDRALFRETKARLQATGIKVLDVELFRLDPVTEPERFEGELDVAAELGARQVICQLPDPDTARKTDRFGRFCDLAKTRGLFCNLEFPHWTETGSLRNAVSVLKSVQKDNAGLLIDMLHFCRSSSSLEELRALPRTWFRMAHLCDGAKEVPPTLEGILHSARHERLFPGEGTTGVKDILACLPLNIPYALEIPKDTMAAAIGLEETARLALRVARSFIDNER